ncbi:MAG: flavocytochrome c [Flavobacteriaceae bacterium]
MSKIANMNFDATADVVVIGGGLAGCSAALSAAQAGADVLLLEKQPDCGGSTVLSGGFLAFAGTDMQEEHGVEDTNELIFKDLMDAGGGANDERLVRTYVEGQLDLYRWLCGLGIRFTDLEVGSGQSVPRGHITVTRTLIDTLRKAAEATGSVTVRYDTQAKELIRDGIDGPVVGVVAMSDGEPLRIGARNGVVLTSGGFSRSEDLLRNFAPNQAKALRIGGAGNTGDGLKMAWRLGAGLRDMGFVKGTFGTHPDTGPDRHELLLAYYVGAIMVNKNAKRFIDESLTYKVLGDACLEQPDQLAFQIWDQDIQDRSEDGVPLFDFKPALESGKLISADTLEELAAKCGLDPEALKATVERYNGDVEGGIDRDFGRDGLSNHHGRIRRIDRAPFYAYPSTSIVLATYCGLTIDENARVIDVMNRPIDRLYAAGEITGGFHGVTYMTGSSLGKAAFFGRLAGRNCAAAAA